MNALRMSDRVQLRQLGPCTLLQLPVKVPQVVRWHGSFASHPNLANGDELVQVVLASLLDKGTQTRDRFELSDELERRGAAIRVGSAGVRMAFRGRAMTRDVPEVMALMAETLREPLLDEGEFVKVKGRVQASVEQARDSTAVQADGALCRRLFSRSHPSFIRSVDDTLAALASMSIDDVRTYFEQHVGANGLVLAVAGDISVTATEKAVDAAFTNWGQHNAVPSHETTIHPVDPDREYIDMADKPALDVRFGHAIPIALADPEWLPLHIGTFVLGGNFSARLMRHIRDELGLTYGISARLRGMRGKAQGYFATEMTLSQENLARGVKEVRQMIRAFVDEGCSVRELDDAKTTIAGAYQVGLSTTSALAARLHNNHVLGFPVDVIDTYVDEVGDLTLEEVRDSVVRTIRPDDLHTVIAGTLSSDA